MILESLLNPQSKVISTSQELDEVIRQLSPFGETSTGLSVTPDSALKVSAVFACVRLLSETVAQLPLNVFRRLPDGGKEKAVDHPLFKLLHLKPNPWQSSFQWREMHQAHMDLRGNSYSFIIRLRSRGNRIERLIPIHPDRVTVEQDENLNVIYKVASRNGKIERFNASRILHLFGFSLDGFQGVSRVGLHREGIGLAMATERHGAKLFGNGTRLGTILKHPNTLSEPAQERLKDNIKQNYTGVDNAFKTMILEEGLEWQTIGMNNEDAQFIESRKFQVNDIARIFNVPSPLVNDLEKSSFNNIEKLIQNFSKFTIAPILARWEQTLTNALIADEEQEEIFIEFNMDGLLRGDFQARMDGYTKGRQWGWWSVDDIRAKENENPLPDGHGQEYLRPLNMVPVDEEVAPEPNEQDEGLEDEVE